MQTEDMVLLNDFCVHHQVEISFVQSLARSGLIELRYARENPCLPQEQLPQLEKMVRLYYEMDINLEGIETISYLLERMNGMQEEIRLLRNRLRVYEED